MPGKLRIGFIGAGGIAIGHYQRLLATKKAQVVAINEPSEQSLRQFHAHCPGSEALPVHRDYRDLLKNERLDGVVVLSPHTVHYEQIAASLKRGLHVLTEKPMVCTIKHAKALIDLAKKTKRTLMIAYQRHYEPTFRYMRDQIRKGRLGEVQFVQAIQAQEWLRLTRGTWRQDPALSGGGQLNDSGSHLVDIVMWVTGMKVKEVYARADNFDTRVDINTSLTMTFENGALGGMSVIGNAPGWYEDHSIVGSKGALYLRQGLGLIHVDAVGRPIPVKLPKYTKNPNSNFVDVILGKAEPETPPECGLRTIEVTEAAWKSAASGRPVRVP
ncbi:MAG TPA: Gfo/Idh/MocA family oxidoreductase [Candidatus Hydrogenedentes bacterium]|nr:Gfo/Idh/MocA family oxidoreductase [Candidatus Hydrogenedentota bacterium]HNT88001.1 Gfo/Idh/MocA family oxidoreductase [Candidatus Hydrogenedentota bacterium]